MNTRENCLRALGNLVSMAIDNTKGSKAVDICHKEILAYIGGSMKFDIRRAYNEKLKKEQKEILEKYNLEIVKEIRQHTYTPNTIEEYYTITLNSIDDLIEIAKELDEDLIIDKNKSIMIYDDYIE